MMSKVNNTSSYLRMMASYSMRIPMIVLGMAWATVLLHSSTPTLVNAQGVVAWAVTDWTSGAHATFYGGQDASGTMGGACGYGNLYTMGYGTANTALSTGLFNNGLTCGACFQIECVVSQSRWCYPGKTVTVTATNACPPGSEGGWCDPPRLHFDLSYPMFTTLAEAVGGVIPVKYKRVSCSKSGGMRFTIAGNPWWQLVLISNIGGGGDVEEFAIEGSQSGNWISATRNWGQNWQVSGHTELVEQPLSFKVTLDNGQSLTGYNAAPSNWGFGETFESDNNF